MKFSPSLSILLLLLVAGCASKGYVNRQIDPVACKVDVLERKAASVDERANALETRLTTLESEIGQAQLANKAMLDEATARASDSAQRAEAAAASATQSAERAEKAFELGQKK